MKKKLILILAVGVLVRLFLAFSTFHSDIQPFYFAGDVIAKGNILNFYDYLGKIPATDPISKIYPANLFNYPPLVYFFLGPLSYLISLPFSRNLLHGFIFNLPGLLGDLRLNFLLLTLKLPYVPFDIGISVLLYKFFKDPKNKLLALAFWIFNPVNLYATYMMGQFDIIPTFFTILALYLAVKREKYFFAALFLGIGASFKIFPALFLIPLALLREKWLDRVKIIGLGALTYVVAILPFLNSPGFRANALVAGQTTKSLYATLPISGGEAVIYFPLVTLFIYIIFFYTKTKLGDFWERFFLIILVFFIFTHTHPQWFLWLTPFLILDLITSHLKHWPLVLTMLVVWLGQVSFFDPGLSVWLFAPIAPSLYGQSGFWNSLGTRLDINFARSILQTVFVSVAAYYIYYYFPHRTDKT